MVGKSSVAPGRLTYRYRPPLCHLPTTRPISSMSHCCEGDIMGGDGCGRDVAACTKPPESCRDAACSIAFSYAPISSPHLSCVVVVPWVAVGSEVRPWLLRASPIVIYHWLRGVLPMASGSALTDYGVDASHRGQQMIPAVSGGVVAC
jgi:hypothetical protein